MIQTNNNNITILLFIFSLLVFDLIRHFILYHSIYNT